MYGEKSPHLRRTHAQPGQATLELAVSWNKTKDRVCSHSVPERHQQINWLCSGGHHKEKEMCQESWKNFITIPLSRPRSSTLFSLFKKDVVHTGDPATGRTTDSDTLQGAGWGERLMCSGVRLSGYKPLLPTH